MLSLEVSHIQTEAPGATDDKVVLLSGLAWSAVLA